MTAALLLRLPCSVFARQLPQIKPAFEDTGKACKGCHDAFCKD